MSIYKGTNEIIGIYKGNTEIVKAYKGTDVVYTKENKSGYIVFTSLSPFSVSTTYNKKIWSGIVEYSTDGSSWKTWTGGSAVSSSLALDGQYSGFYCLYFRGLGNTQLSGTSGSWNIYSPTSSDVMCDGDLKYVVDYQNSEGITLYTAAFGSMFANNLNLVSAPQMSFTTLPMDGCNSMFKGCSKLIIPPKLPATTLNTSCYMHMFKNCYALTTLPLLPATGIQTNCYQEMFYGCSNIKLSSTSSNVYKYQFRMPSVSNSEFVGSNAFKNMFTGTGGTFTSTPNANKVYYTDHQPI